MGCLNLQLKDYFQLVENSHTKYREARFINGIRQNYEYDLKNQLTAVTDNQGNIIEQYTYDPAGNILKKTINGIKTTFEYDEANQLTSSLRSPSAKSSVSTAYSYDSAGRMTREGNKTYQYGWLDKVMNISENGKITANYDYHINGQIAESMINGISTNYEWDGLALIKRGSTNLTNEPAVTGGNLILADNNVLFNDMLGTTIGIAGSKGKKTFTPTETTAFGESSVKSANTFFTGKPHVAGLGYAFLFRNYRANLGKWQTSDPLGYPDGWNNLAYGNNQVTSGIDSQGTAWVLVNEQNGIDIYNANNPVPQPQSENLNPGSYGSSGQCLIVQVTTVTRDFDLIDSYINGSIEIGHMVTVQTYDVIETTVIVNNYEPMNGGDPFTVPVSTNILSVATVTITRNYIWVE
ncbi:MAG: hypothetical protein L3J71_04165 [Victivallaceae bacterium]|nr:hypothetical protein [Victivallaceae bacterium]